MEVGRKVSLASAMAQADGEKHQNAIDQLARDNQKLIQELSLEQKQDTMVNNSAASAEIKRLQDQGDAYTRKIELEKRRIAELEKQIDVVQKKVNAQRKKMGGVNVSMQNNKVLTKQIRVLENRLDKSIVRYNEILGKNKLLREKIDDLRKERLIFDGVYRKLEKEIQTEKKDMVELIEKCNKAYEERDVAKQEISKLKKQADEEQERFQVEWKRLEDLIEQDKRAKEFNQLPETEEEGSVKESAEGAKLKRKVAKGAWSIGKNKAQIQLTKEKAHDYEEMFAKIQEETGVSDIDELVKRFVQGEESNFALFNQVTNLNKEIETLEHKISGVESEIEKYRGNGAQSENQRKRILADLDTKLTETNERADLYEQRFINSQKILEQLQVGVQAMCDGLGTSKDKSLRALVGSEGVNESNVLQYLGVIEQKANEILQAFDVGADGSLVEPASPAASPLLPIESGSNPALESSAATAAGGETDDSGDAQADIGQGQASARQRSPFPGEEDFAAQEKLSEELFEEDDSERPLTTTELQASMANSSIDNKDADKE